MASRVTQEDIIRINEIYYRLKTYAATAREVGFAASTVKKYVIDGYVPQAQIRYDDRKIELPPTSSIVLDNLPTLSLLSPREWEEIEELRKEILV